MKRVVSSIMLVVVVAACAGANSSDITDNGGSGASPSGSTSSGSTSSSTSSASSTSSSSSSGGEDGGKPDASSSSGDSGPGGSIKCGAKTCKPGAEFCCRTTAGVGTFNYTCLTTGTNCNSNNQLAIPCDDATDCSALGQPGSVCCGKTAGALDNRITKVTCEKLANCPSDSAAVLCDGAGPPGQCPGTTTCRASITSLPDYNLCLQ